MQLRPTLLAAILSLLALLCAAQAREISTLTVEWAPHYGAEFPENGLTTAVVKAAFKEGSHSSGVDFIPWANALKQVGESKADQVMGAHHNKKREKIYIFSDPIYLLEPGQITRTDLGVYSYNSLRDLAAYRIGISRGFANSRKFDAANYVDKQVATHPNFNIRKHFRGRIDLTRCGYPLTRCNNRELRWVAG